MLLLEQFEILSKQEKRRFSQWLELELEGKEPSILAMARFIVSNEKSDLTVSPDLENRAIRSKLLHKLQEFIAIEAFKKDQAQKDLYYMKEVFERKQVHLFPKFYKKALKRLPNQYHPSANYFYFLFQFEWFNHVYAIQNTPRKEARTDFIGKRTQYFVQWLKHELALLQLHFFHKEPGQKNFAELLTWLGRRKEDTVGSEELDLFFAMKDLFGNDRNSRSPMEQEQLEQKVLNTLQHSQTVSQSTSFTDLQSMAINYFIRKADENPVELSFLQLRELYNWMLTNKLIPFTTGTFRTISMTYLTLAYLQKNRDKQHMYIYQAQAFMKKHKKRLPAHEQENAHTFMKAYQDFILKKYSEVRKGGLFRTGEKQEPHYEFGYQFIVLQTEYELGDRSEIRTNLRHLKDRIRKRKGLNKRSQLIYMNRIRFFTKLLRTDDWDALKNMQQEIKKTRLLGGRVWLLEKIQEKLDQFLTLNY